MTSKALRLVGLLSLALVFLSACEVADPVQPQPDLTYQHLKSIPFAVAQVTVIDDYTPPLVSPNVEHRFRTRPSVALERWGLAKLMAAGGPGTLRMTIQEASVVEQPLKLDTSLKGRFTTQQAFRYNANFKVLVEVLNENGRREAHTITQITRTITVPEDATLNDRHGTWLFITEKAMGDFDREMVKNISQFLGPWVR